jgi:hypothetical protein
LSFQIVCSLHLKTLTAEQSVNIKLYVLLHKYSSETLRTLEARFCGLVVRVLSCRSGGPGSIPGTTRKKILGLDQGPLSLVSTTEELLDRKVAAPV